MAEEKKIEKKTKGRKFIALVLGLLYAIFFHVTCMIDKSNIELLSFSIVVVSFVAAYIGGNTLSKKFENEK